MFYLDELRSQCPDYKHFKRGENFSILNQQGSIDEIILPNSVFIFPDGTAVYAATTGDKPPGVIDGLRWFGQGRMGRVKATNFPNRVLKILGGEYFLNNGVERAKREAEIYKSIYGYGEYLEFYNRKGQLKVALLLPRVPMQKADGSYSPSLPLDIVLAERKENLSFQQRLTISILALEALQKFHNAGYVHVDVKPENFICEFDAHEQIKQVYLIDFSLSVKAGHPHPYYMGTYESNRAIEEKIDHEFIEKLHQKWAPAVPFEADTYSAAVTLEKIMEPFLPANGKIVNLIKTMKELGSKQIISEAIKILRTIQPELPPLPAFLVADVSRILGDLSLNPPEPLPFNFPPLEEKEWSPPPFNSFSKTTASCSAPASIEIAALPVFLPPLPASPGMACASPFSISPASCSSGSPVSASASSSPWRSSVCSPVQPRAGSPKSPIDHSFYSRALGPIPKKHLLPPSPPRGTPPRDALHPKAFRPAPTTCRKLFNDDKF